MSVAAIGLASLCLSAVNRATQNQASLGLVDLCHLNLVAVGQAAIDWTIVSLVGLAADVWRWIWPYSGCGLGHGLVVDRVVV